MFEENQMGLFEIGGAAPVKRERHDAPPPAKPARARAEEGVRKGPRAGKAKPGKVVAQPRKVSGLVPEGDVRLTANIRQDLHLKLKIASAHRRTTIGEILEELIERYI